VLVLDNFEDNLVAGGGAFKDETVMAVVEDLATHAKAG
jgi:hypothetical protein